MSEVIQKDCWVSINLNELVSIRASFLEEKLTLDQVDEIANELRVRMTFDSIYGQVDQMIWEVTDNTDMLPQYGQISPEPGREAELIKREKEQKAREKYFKDNFEMVDLVSPSWTIQVPRRKSDG